jgi:diaminopimelate decarboxylase
MKHIRYIGNTLHCEDVLVAELAEEYGTPLYVYSKNEILDSFRSVRDALGSGENLVCYALKANSNQSILKMLAEQGAGADVVSAGELFLALHAGFAPEKIAFAGVGKREDEIEYALNQNIACFNVESTAELQLLSLVAVRLNKRTNVSVRINPDIDAQSHPYITTGLNSNKFGVEAAKALDVFTFAATMPHLNITGIHTHIGSQIIKQEPFVATATFAAELVGKLRAAGIRISHIDFGGGIGVKYFNAIAHEGLPKEDPQHEFIPSPAQIVAAVLPTLQQTGCSIWLEPGRSIVAESGMLVTKVLFRKSNGLKKFLIVDAAMNDLIRPALYQAHHQIAPVEIDTYEHEQVDVVGPVCETGDFLAKDRMLTKSRQGEILAVLTTGAYGFVNTSNYNARLRPAEVLVNGDRVRLIRPRETFEDLLR